LPKESACLSRIWHVAYGILIVVLLALVSRLQGDRESLFRQISDHVARDQVELAARFQDSLIRHTDNFERVTWLGHPVWQSVMDLWTLQETIAEVRPALLIECGTWKGGSALFAAHLFDLMGQGTVISVDIKKFHDLSHPRITFLIGDCASEDVVTRIRAVAENVEGPILVMLDSDHSAEHVSKELRAYAPLVTLGSFLHVQDGVIDLQRQFVDARPGPLRAIEDFLSANPAFQADSARSARFLITHHPKGWLRRVGADSLLVGAGD
jgi:cephalosporin hydroxylase